MKESDYNFSELIHNASFKRWVEGNASAPEKEYWDEWVMRDSQNRVLAIRAQRHIAGFSIEPSSQPAQNEAWSRIERKMGADRNYVVSPSQNKGLQWIYRVAAIFLLAALTGLAVSFMVSDHGDKVQKQQMVRNEVVTGYGERKTINLSDGSEIILNAHSNLVYTVDPADSNAVEVLLDGEAYFSIAKREELIDTAFRVKTSSGLIKVMGTKFVVSTRNQNTQVVLEEGEVVLAPSNKVKETILRPNQLAEFGADSSTVQTRYVNTEVYSSWTTYTLVFDKTPFRDVVARLENTYGVKVVVREPDLYEREISGSIDNSGLKIITDALSKTLDTPIEITDKAVYVGNKISDGPA